MDAVGLVDLQFLLASGRVIDKLIDTSRTVTALRTIVDLQVVLDGHGPILESQMARLVLLMISIAAAEVGEQIKADLAIRFGVLDAGGLFLGEKSLMVMMVVLEGEWKTSSEEEGVEGAKGKTKEHAVLEGGAEVPDLVEFLVEP